MFPKIKFAHITVVISLVLFSTFVLAPSITTVQARGAAPATLPDFKQFVTSVNDGSAGVVRGVYVPGLFAVKVLQQPGNNPGYVSPVNDIITEFSLAKNYGNIGLLAHNYLTGASFSNLLSGQEIRIVYGNGDVEYFVVEKVLRYQALEPNSSSSDFINLDTGLRESATTLFHQVYGGQRHLTFQTCIFANGIFSWGRLFVIAVPFTNNPKINLYEGFRDIEISS